METVIVTSWIIANVILGLTLGFWHRNLMVYLYAEHPEVWQRLGQGNVQGRFWSLSRQFPFWTWSSLFFFVAKKYNGLDDPAFSMRAAPFRLTLMIWLVGFSIGTVLTLVL